MKPRRRPGLGSGNLSGRGGISGWGPMQVQWPSAGPALLVAAMLVSFVFLHTEVEWIEEDPEGLIESDPASMTEGAAAFLGAAGAVGDKRLLQQSEEGEGRQRGALQQGRFWERVGQEDDKPSWQRALEEQRQRRLEREARKAGMWGGETALAVLEDQQQQREGSLPGGNLSAVAGSRVASLLSSRSGVGFFSGLGKRRLGTSAQDPERRRRQLPPLSTISGVPGTKALAAKAIMEAGGGASGSGAASDEAKDQAVAGDPQAAAKAAARAASTGGRIENKEEWEKAMQRMSQTIVADVTVVITPKHWLSIGRYQLQQLLELTPPGIRIVYFLSASAGEADRAYLRALAAKCPSLDVREAGAFASGFSMRNASVELIKTKYALYIFNDVVPLHKYWLHEVYSVAEQRPEGVIFLPYVWQKGRPTSMAPAAARKRKALLKATSSSASASAAASASASQQTAAASSSPVDSTAQAPSPEDAQSTGFAFPEDTVTSAHGPFAQDMVFDDFSNDGKLYVQRIEDSQVTGSRDPAQLEPRESPAAVEDHCMLVRQSFLEEALVFDPRASWTRQDLDIALTVRYYNYRSFLVPQSQVAFLHPSLGMPLPPPLPAQLAYFVSQSNDDACSANQVYLRQKWGVVTGQLCRGFVDAALRHVQWGVSELGTLSKGRQLQLLLGFFSLLGMNRFQLKGLDTWHQPALAAPPHCKGKGTKDKDKEGESPCQPVPDWMASASSDFISMISGAASLDSAFQRYHERVKSLESADGPVLRMGRAELLLPLRVNRVEDLWRAASLREGQLFTVRRGTLKTEEKHPGRRAPELPYLMRMYLPFVVLEFEMEMPLKEAGGLDSTRGGAGSGVLGGTAAASTGSGAKPSGAGGSAAASLGKLCFFEGMSVVIQERCMVGGKDSAGSGSTGAGYLLQPGGRGCVRSSSYFRAFMFVRHADMGQTPLRMFDKLRRSFQRSMPVEEGSGGWLEGKKMTTWLTPCFGAVIKRMRMVRCVPGAGDACVVGVPLGSAPDSWVLALFHWRPQSVRTAQVLLLQPGASKIII